MASLSTTISVDVSTETSPSSVLMLASCDADHVCGFLAGCTMPNWQWCPLLPIGLMASQRRLCTSCWDSRDCRYPSRQAFMIGEGKLIWPQLFCGHGSHFVERAIEEADQWLVSLWVCLFLGHSILQPGERVVEAIACLVKGQPTFCKETGDNSFINFIWEPNRCLAWSRIDDVGFRR